MLTKPEFRMLVGLPGSGKSYYSKEFIEKNPEYIYLSSDNFRKEHGLKDTDNSFWDEFNQLAKLFLSAGKSVLYDATNVNSKRRAELLNRFKKIDCTKTCVVMATTLDACLKNNRSWSRDHIVPDTSVIKFYHHFQFPQYFEGWDNIVIHKPHDITMSKTYCVETILKNVKDYDQNSKWHKYTLGGHMTRVGDYLKSKGTDEELVLAGYIHDIGKPYVKTTDDEGQSHYKHHDNVGAYESMFIKGTFNRVRVAQIIALHMNAHMSEWAEKYKALIGKPGYEILKDVFMLEEADSHSWE